MAAKTAAKNKKVSQIGLSTHSQDHEIHPIIFNITKNSVSAMIGSLPGRFGFSLSAYQYLLPFRFACAWDHWTR